MRLALSVIFIIYYSGLVILKSSDPVQQNYQFVGIALVSSLIGFLLQLCLLFYSGLNGDCKYIMCNGAWSILHLTLPCFDDEVFRTGKYNQLRVVQYFLLGLALQRVDKMLSEKKRYKYSWILLGGYFIAVFSLGQFLNGGYNSWLDLIIVEIIVILIIIQKHWVFQRQLQDEKLIEQEGIEQPNQIGSPAIMSLRVDFDQSNQQSAKVLKSDIYQKLREHKKDQNRSDLDVRNLQLPYNSFKSPIKTLQFENKQPQNQQDQILNVYGDSHQRLIFQQSFQASLEKQKNFYKMLFNQFPDGMIILAEDQRIQYQNKCILNILNTQNRQDTIKAVMELKNCQSEFEEQTKFFELFKTLDKKLKVQNITEQQQIILLQDDQFKGDNFQSQEEIGASKNIMEDSFNSPDEMENYIQPYISNSSTVKEEYNRAILQAQIMIKEKTLHFQNMGRNDYKEGNYNSMGSNQTFKNEELKFISEIRMLCKIGGYEEDQSQSQSEHINSKGSNSLLEITLKPYILEQKPYVFIRIRDVTLFNEFSVLQQINENKSKMLYQVSHEFRTPLNCIILMVETLKQEYGINSKLCQDFYDPILTSASQLLCLINDLLDLAQLKAGKFKLQFQDFDLRKSLYAISTMLAPAVAAKQLQLNLVVDNTVPLMIKSDQNRIRQVLINLISNSIKFTHFGAITIDVKYIRNQIQIAVSDTGCGIKEEDQGKLFQAFGKLERTSDINQQGVGLGLMISHILAQKIGSIPNTENHCKGLQVFSQGKDHGSTFQFNIYNHREHNDAQSSRYLDRSVISIKYQDNQVDLNSNKSQFGINSSKYKVKSEQFIESEGKIGITFHLDNEFASKNYLKEQTNTQQIIKVGKSQLVAVNLGRQLEPQKQKLRLDVNSRVQQPLPKIFGEQPSDFSPKGITEDMLQQRKSIYNFKKCQCPEILIIDDEPFNIMALQQRIKKYDIKTEKAFNAEETICKVNLMMKSSCCRNYKIILMDVNMPGIDGFELTRIIRQIEEQIMSGENNIEKAYIIGCTGFGDSCRKECLISGMDDYLNKPVNINELTSKIKRRIEIYNLH